MKFFYSFFLILNVLLCTGSLNAFSQTDGEKVYVSKDEILITDDALFLIEEGSLLPLSYIGVDSEGLYIEVGGSWKCSRCGILNCNCEPKCIKCGLPRG